ncbi:MAG: UDP-N-acetylmuramoyl-L-alanyl-D-glutamate--2,6-diaminopimelate ligase [Acidobacteria bacterium]|nr:UDP-N-acetylmuramoyl-L-alanyl-D-glutamate--2,6-diaminopimelate ligase [Acidobacteriota bacterium]
MELEEVMVGISLLSGLPEGLRRRPVLGLEYDSRRVAAGFLFFAFPGAKTDGRAYARQAIERGALAVISELPPPDGFDEPWIRVEHGRRALALACRNFFGAPERDLMLHAVTGTNGKTTITYLLDALFRAAGCTTAFFGTAGYRIAGESMAAVNTTPESLDLYRMFERLRVRGGTHVSMEASSHALALGRIWGLAFHTAVFSNLSQDHLDFHQTMEAYFDAKRSLFFAHGAAAPKYSAINVDDQYGRRIRPGAETKVITYGLGEGACVRAVEIETNLDGVRFTLRHESGSTPIRSALSGRINVYNILAASSAGIACGFDLGLIAQGIASCEAVPGRFERVDQGQPFLVVVDYAHTEDALRNAIEVARSLGPKRVITLFGCGGDRDRAKRPLMGMAAAQLSDFVVLTSDNPRSEDPLNIINDALVGLRRLDTRHVIEPDRARAIRLAIGRAQPGDLVLIAGKGHETQQVLRDQTIDFDDRAVAREILEEFGYRRKTG